VSGGSSSSVSANAKAAAVLQIQVAKGLQDFWRSEYKPIESKIADYAINQTVPTVNGQKGRFVISMKSSFKDAYATLQRNFQPYATGFNQIMISDLTQVETRAIVDAVMMSYRYAEQRTQALDDIRWDRMIRVAGIGRGVLQTSMSYASSAGKNGAVLARQADQSSREFAKGLAYITKRAVGNKGVPKYNYKTTPNQPTVSQHYNKTGEFPVGINANEQVKLPQNVDPQDGSLMSLFQNIFKG
jgi:hypothetical protein